MKQFIQSNSIITAIVVILASCNTSSPEGENIQLNQKVLVKSMYGENWALMVDSAVVECVQIDLKEPAADQYGYVLHAGGKSYSINGTAKSLLKYPDVLQIVIMDSGIMKESIKQGIDPKYLMPFPKDYQYLLNEADKLCK